MKRLLDIALSGLLLVPVAPIILVLALLIRLETPGNPFFSQTRVGRKGQYFTIWKLRSMHAGTPDLGTHEVAPEATTGVGHFIRRFKLDELPQLLNILMGDMSLVGPRPCLPGQSDVIAERDNEGVFVVRPGITGLAQIRGIDMSRPRELALADREYIDRQSLALDIEICLKTIAGVLKRR